MRMAVFWCGSCINAASALGNGCTHVVFSNEEQASLCRIRYRNMFADVVTASRLAEGCSRGACLVGSPKDRSIAEVMDLANKIEVDVVALALWWQPAKAVEQPGWSVACKLVLWEGLGGPSCGFNFLVLMRKGEGHGKHLQEVLDAAIAKAKPWRKFVPDPKSSTSTLEAVVSLPKPEPKEAAAAAQSATAPQPASEDTSEKKPATEDASEKMPKNLDALRAACAQLQSVAGNKRPWYIPVVSGSKKPRVVSTVPPEFKARNIVLARIDSGICQLGANEMLQILGWDSDQINVHLMPSACRPAVIAASVPKPVAEILLAAAVMDVGQGKVSDCQIPSVDTVRGESSFGPIV